jgi:flagellar biosynthesis GTPase FlhF
MKIQNFIAPNLRDARSQRKSEFGKDAIILSTKQLPQGGIEVTAASKEEEKPTQHRTASTRGLRGCHGREAHLAGYKRFSIRGGL